MNNNTFYCLLLLVFTLIGLPSCLDEEVPVLPDPDFFFADSPPLLRVERVTVELNFSGFSDLRVELDSDYQGLTDAQKEYVSGARVDGENIGSSINISSTQTSVVFKEVRNGTRACFTASLRLQDGGKSKKSEAFCYRVP